MVMTALDLSLNINGKTHILQVDPNRLLLDILREEVQLKGATYGCGLAQCGACTVLIDGNPARACVLRVRHASGDHEITTLEGLVDGENSTLHPVQEAFIEMDGTQCGYCLNGMIMTSVALLARNSNPTVHEVREALKHNLCRCGAHTEIVASVLRAAEKAATVR